MMPQRQRNPEVIWGFPFKDNDALLKAVIAFGRACFLRQRRLEKSIVDFSGRLFILGKSMISL
jgi:hypothetical protein